jgi:hypothetical protein
MLNLGNFKSLKLLGGVVAGVAIAILPTISSADTIAYNDGKPMALNPMVVGNRGMDFTVNSAIFVTQLGAFDDGITSNLAGNTKAGVEVGIFNTSGVEQGTTANFSATNVGHTIAGDTGDAFQTITPFKLQPGTYSIVALNDNYYGAGSMAMANKFSTENNGGGLITFTGYGRHDATSSTLEFPTAVVNSSGISNPYDAGTFVFAAAPLPAAVLGGLMLLAGLAAKRGVSQGRLA